MKKWQRKFKGFISPSTKDSHTRPSAGVSGPHAPESIPQSVSVSPDDRIIHNATLPEGSFANAHNFTIGNAYMLDSHQEDKSYATHERWAKEQLWAEKEKQAQEKQVQEKQAQEALRELVAKGMPGAMLDSRERAYAPRCNEDTRRTLRRYIVKWGRNDEEEQRLLLWLSGPAAVGKSAVAQTVAEELKWEGLLGAVFFFSRPNNRSDPDVVIPTLVYQLALLLPEYSHIIAQRLAADSLLLSKSRRSQFKELIVDPFLTLASRPPLLIILDGLDECNDRDAQCEFVALISHYVRTHPGSRLRWMICSRPEHDLKAAFSTEDCRAVCLHTKLEIDSDEAQEDARRILEKGFAEIRQRYPDHLTQDWPDERQVTFIAERASGHLGFASFIVRFIGDRQYDDPSGQLEACLKFLKRTGDSGDLNPLHALDLLYTQILSDIPTTVLPTTQRILGLFILYRGRGLDNAAALANFLGLTQASFYRALQRLHSVVFVPSASKVGSILIYHASFTDFLRDAIRSAGFALNESAVHSDVAIQGLRWLSYCRKIPSEDHESSPKLTWIPPTTTDTALLDQMRTFSFETCWQACPRVPKDSRAKLIESLEGFDFDLDYCRWWKSRTSDFAHFLRWLVSPEASYTNLVFIDRWNTYPHHDSTPKRGTTILHQDEDPDAFVAPFLKKATGGEPYIIRLRLGKINPVAFWLNVGSGNAPSFHVE